MHATTTRTSFLERLERGDVLIADGATGTTCQRMGLPLGVAPEEWVLTQPERIVELHRGFAEAGSDIVLTCTFGGTSIRLADGPFAGRAPELNRRAAELAREAVGQAVLVAGSLGPTGELCEPLGTLTHDEAASAYAEQAEALAEGGADLLVLETMFCQIEAGAAIEGVRRATDLPFVLTFSFDRGTRTMMGTTTAEVVALAIEQGAAAVGANCGTSLDNMAAIVAELSAASAGLPLWVKPNAGLPRMTGDSAVYDVTPDDLAQAARGYVEAGARIVGGCCGSTPEHVRAIAEAIRRS
ncbi:MAG: 5-methyltetrahydrofolate--homocysteine methyltransferase [Gaiellales bacterium]|jgi:5-methyltetrahydrofolate--homocysteine methyltransferase|nr:5-methyltetrahydrofolate--homocysteine methyltransferase [Gaiellales bacterium]